MNYLLQCSDCGATCWVSGNYESDTNALNLDDPEEWTIDHKFDYLGISWCSHTDYEVIDEEYPEPLWDDVI